MTASGVLLALCLAGSQPTGLLGMFDAPSKDFGNVPYGSVNMHRFVLKNTGAETIQATSVHSSCHCATPKLVTSTAEPGKDLVVEVAYDASKFTGPRSMIITVSFQKPRYESVALRVSGVSRTDVVVRPSQVDFGAIAKGTVTSKSATIEYTGAADFRVGELTLPDGFVAKVQEIGRRVGLIQYRVDVTLKEGLAPASLSETIRIKTNDPSTPYINLLATATIQAPLVAQPASVQFGSIKTGDKVAKNVILKGDKPFVIKWVKGQDNGVSVFCTEGARTVHMLKIELEAQKPGQKEHTIDVQTDLNNERLPVSVLANIQP